MIDRPSRRRHLLGLAALSTAPGINKALAQGAEWPAGRPIRLVVGGAPGAGSDLFARLFAEQIGQAIKQRIVVDNKPGANGIIANDIVAKAPADGYTLLFSYAAAIAVNQALQPSLPYDTLRDLQPVAQIGAGGTFLVVTPDIAANNLREFVEMIRAQPGKYNYASWGIGSGGHLQMEWLMMTAGLKMTHVPYKATAPMINDLSAGIVKIGFADTASATPLIKAGRLKALAISGTKHAPAMPEVRTMIEQGYAFDIDAWYCLLAPAGTPTPIVRRLNAEVHRILDDPANGPRFAALNFALPAPQKTPEQFRETIRRDIEQWSRVIKSANIKPD